LFKHNNFSLFVKINLFLTIAIYLLFLSLGQNYTLLSFTLTSMGAISTAATLVLVLYLLFYFTAYLKKPGLYLFSLAFVILDLALIVDFFIHRIYHFHINAMVLNIITSPAAIDSIQLGIAPYIMFFVIIAALIAFEFYTIRFLYRYDEAKKASMNRKLNRVVVLPIFLIVLIEKISFGFADVYSKGEVLSKFAVIPLYQPLTFTKLASKYLGIKPQEVATSVVTNTKELNYPLTPLEYSDTPKRTNIFIFAADAVRNSIITEEVAPNITAFAKESYRYNNHYSGGIATRSGIFSLMYGVNASYWFKFLAANQGSVLFTALQALQYQIQIISSTDTNWPEFRKTCYVDIQPYISDTFKGNSVQKDRQSADYFKEWINSSDLKKPLFSFMFWDATHGRVYPKTFRKFLPDDNGNINYLTLDEKTGKSVVFNQYKNSVAYDDALFGEMITFLKEKGLYDDAIVIFTSDHGEEFYEMGHFGHNNAFDRPQAQPVFIVKFPGKSPKSITALTSHVDVVPTLLKYIGVTTDPSMYSNGFDLLSDDYHRDYVNVANWDQNAIINDKQTMIFANRPDKIFNNEIRTNEAYKKVPEEKEEFDNTLVFKVLQDNQKFLK